MRPDKSMVDNPDLCHRRSIRLRGYDYARAGTYFITICTHQKQSLFGEIAEGEMRLNALGSAVRQERAGSGRVRAEIDLDEFVVMPNHLHGIVRIVGADGVRPRLQNPASSASEVGALCPPLRGLIAGIVIESTVS